jgi:predicted DNA-binding transcriptional regulator AlpA
MKLSVKQQLAYEVGQTAPRSIVIVEKKYADFFRPPPPDGRTYIVQDERRPWIKHVTGLGIAYTINEQSPKFQISCSVNGVRVKPKYGPKTAPKQIDKATRYENATAATPVIRLIGIKRVEDITGFGKSFIYEQCGKTFPQRIEFGASKRSASRWIESEVIAWVTQQVSKRATQVKNIKETS